MSSDPGHLHFGDGQNSASLNGSYVGEFWVVKDGAERKYILPYRIPIVGSQLSAGALGPDVFTDKVAWMNFADDENLAPTLRALVRRTRPTDWPSGKVFFDVVDWSFVVIAEAEIRSDESVRTQVEEQYGFWLLKRRWPADAASTANSNVRD